MSKDATGQDELAVDAPKSGPPPPWHTLPYAIWVTIFDFAAHAVDKTFPVHWLLGMSRVCKAFAEPALTVLYRSPPLLPASRAHRLARMLSDTRRRTTFNYRAKIESVKIDVGQLAKPVWNSQHLDYRALIRGLPRLSELIFFHEKDMSPYRSLDDNIRWEYPDDLFEVLKVDIRLRDPAQLTEPAPPVPERQEEDGSEDAVTIRLKSWTWNSRMMGQTVPLERLQSIHQSECFHGLRKLAFTNFQVPSLKAPKRGQQSPEMQAADSQFISSIANSLEALPYLKHLIFESSTAVIDALLQRLPKGLEHLELINCWDIQADEFAEYLLSRGGALRHLTLLHNQSLSLSFLPILGDACPNLVSLRMNFTYFKHHEAYNDSAPSYADVLLEHERPTWPGTLQILELEHIRRWSTETAEMFFQSIIDSASHLPHLRRLVIKAVLDIAWRQRSTLRDKWVHRFNEVFKRVSEPPRVHSTIVRKTAPDTVDTTSGQQQRSPGDPMRRSARIATAQFPASGAATKERRNLKSSYRESGSDDESESESVRRPIHGMCDYVDIRIDNQKPAEHQYGMSDFLDSDESMSEASWDGDWDSDGDRYAW